MKFREKSGVTINAIQFKLADCPVADDGMRRLDGMKSIGWCATFRGDTVEVINAPDNKVVAVDGDWIIRAVNNDLLVCKTDVFAKTYEAVDSAAA